MSKRKKKEQINEPYYLVFNKQGEVFTGLYRGQFMWSNDWDEAKPLKYSNTKYIREFTTGTELILETEI